MILDRTRRALRRRKKLLARRGHADKDHRQAPSAADVMQWPAPTVEQAAHLMVLGASGTGKTLATAGQLVGELSRHPDDADAPSYLVVDPKGDLALAVVSACAHRGLLGRLNYLDPFEVGFPFDLRRLASGKTPLELRAAQLAGLVANVSTAAGAMKHLGVGARQLDVLTNTLLAALDCDVSGANVLWALDALTQKKGLARLAAATGSARAKSFLTSARLGDELKASTSSRLRTALGATEHLERVFCAGQSVQFADLLAPGRITVVNLGSPPGGMVALTAFWSNVVVRLAIDHLMERPSPFSGHHCRLAVDEAQAISPVLSDVAERVLTTGRSRNVSLVLLSQGTSLIHASSKTLLSVILTNTPVRHIGRLAAVDAELLARSETAAPGVDEPIGTLRARFAASVSNLADREFYVLTPGGRARVRSPDVPVDAWDRARKERDEECMEVMRRFALADSGPREQLPALPRKKRAPRRTTRQRPAPTPSPPRGGKPSRWG